jgi:hypothetical protein
MGAVMERRKKGRVEEEMVTLKGGLKEKGETRAAEKHRRTPD